jgi:acyl-CoA synthetase (AMP-forming)/AMP-acid ligase II
VTEAGAVPEAPTPDPPLDAFARVHEIVDHWAGRTPGAPAASGGGRLLSYAELAAAGEAAAAVLTGHGLRAGDRLLLVIENGLAAVVLFLAASRLGAWAVPVNARLTGPEIAAIRDHARPRLSFYTTGVSPEAAAHAEADGAEAAAELAELEVAWRREAGDPEPEPSNGPDPVAALLYTSGTTGAPKGVMLSHRNLVFAAGRSSQTRDARRDDHCYGVLPMSHVYGLTAVLLATLYRGARIELVPRFDPNAAARALAEDGITVFQGVPAIFAYLLGVAKAQGAPLAAPALRVLSSGGAPLDVALKRGIEAMFGVPLINGYGLTETSPTISISRHAGPNDDVSTGPPLPDVETRIVSPEGPEGADLPEGEIGELWVRGGLVMRGYYRDPTRTAEVLTPDGWFKTGDLAQMSPAGDLIIAGRLKELIIRSGFNVYPPEVEAAIASHPGVVLAAVIGRAVPDNEEVVAFVQPRTPGALDLEALAAHVAERLAPYKRPAEYLLRETLPLTAAGKVRKQMLKSELES